MDILTRLRRVLPAGWFADDDPVLDTILNGCSAIWTALLDQLDQVRQQARLLTATGTWLDAKVADYLGAGFKRRTNEADASFATRAAREVLRPRATRPALELLLTEVGATPFRIVEPSRPLDTGGYDVGGVGYDAGGAWGSLLTPYQAFLTVSRPVGAGIPNNGAWNVGMGFDVGGGGYGTYASLTGGLTDDQLYQTISRTLPAGVTAWTRIE